MLSRQDVYQGLMVYAPMTERLYVVEALSANNSVNTLGDTLMVTYRRLAPNTPLLTTTISEFISKNYLVVSPDMLETAITKQLNQKGGK